MRGEAQPRISCGVRWSGGWRSGGRGRPRGKRRNPEWKLYSDFLKRRTQREAVALLATK
jgi:hypothetical protein